MSRYFRLAAIFFLFFMGIVCLPNPLEAAAGVTPVTKDKAIARVRFENDFDLIFLKVQVNNSKPLWFLLDTGFDANILNAKWVKPLNIELKDKQTVPQPGGAIEMGSASNLSFKLPGLELSNQNANSAPLSSLEPIVGRSIDGILGHDFLAQFTTEIDYANKTITFYEPQNYEYKGRGEFFSVEIEDKQPFLKGKILQTRPIEGKFKVDTGSVDVMGLNKNFLENAKVLMESQKTVAEPGVGVGGETKGISFRVNAIQFGSFVLKSPIIGATLDSSGFENRTDAGTIGAGILKRFKVILDYSHNRIILEKNRNFAAPFTHDTSGLRIVAEGTDFKIFKIVNVLKNSPASASGILEGDIVTSINGLSIEKLSLSMIRQLLLNGNNKVYRLKVKRNRKELPILIKLRELI